MSPHAPGDVTVMIALTIVKTLILVVGGTITYLTLKAYRRTRRRELGLLAVGFGVVTLGFVLAGVLFEVLEVALPVGILIESLLVLGGFLVIAYSLYVD
ncbi:DUF7521 family protein [Natronosalvus rutilus]|uniref:Uncharacterized protein n=1 Tax=Natronosalvus rutilus TaxID=2953753 RepID=A0A9E7SWZ6_9EURY|nr:hypothetical protein [Natronosalvus rutilus]UTF53653.1 hypothetical protein NGM29_18105 [Natronosalvus rutilus]